MDGAAVQAPFSARTHDVFRAPAGLWEISGAAPYLLIFDMNTIELQFIRVHIKKKRIVLMFCDLP